MDAIDFMPLVSANYSGGIIITDWYSEQNSNNESVKITIRFLTNEIRADALDIKVFKKVCPKPNQCVTTKTGNNLIRELKRNILRKLTRAGCKVKVIPAKTPAEDVLAEKPDGVFLSNGPGDPAAVTYAIKNVKALMGKVPVFGICLGHQILARAMGAQTFKLKFGHRGGNHPVKDLSDGRVYITAQNHGYAVSAESLPAGLEISHINLNDDTIEGLRHRELPVFTIQYHSEGSPGPHDNEYLFDRFLKLVQGAG